MGLGASGKPGVVPTGLGYLFSSLPGTYVTGYHIPPLCGQGWAISPHSVLVEFDCDANPEATNNCRATPGRTHSTRCARSGQANEGGCPHMIILSLHWFSN